VATCNDCHLKHNFVGKWMTKTSNGFFHSLAFTTGHFPDPILIKPHNREVAEASCLHCHEAIVSQMHAGDRELSCIRCHGAVGHPLLVPGAAAPARR
jgi:cytochrome c nitrite reductase small subunit